MEKFKTIIGLLSMSIVVLGTLFKFMQLPGTGNLIIIGGSALAVYASFVTGVIKASFTRENRKPFDILGNKKYFLGQSLSVVIVGLMFCTMLWPGARIMLIVGTGSIVVTALIYVYAIVVKQEKFKISMPVIYIVIGISALLLSAAHTADRIAEHQETQQNTH